jgi:hypothetical protein
LNYTDEQLQQPYEEHAKLTTTYSKLSAESVEYGQALITEKAIKFMMHGIGRRLGIIYRCIPTSFGCSRQKGRRPSQTTIEWTLMGFLKI